MDRAAFPSSRKSLLLPALAAVMIGGAWWWMRPPSEPLIQGRRLSEYLVNEGDRFRQPGAEQLAKLGPAGIAWLAYKVEHGRHPFQRRGPLPLVKAPDWIRRCCPAAWGGLCAPSAIDERVEAMKLLEFAGPRAESAIPALVRSLESEDGQLAYRTTFRTLASEDERISNCAAFTLQMMGRTSLPAVLEVMDRGSPRVRIALIESFSYRLGFSSADKPNDPGVAPSLAALVKMLRDPNPEVRQAAAMAISDCKRLTKDIRYDSAIPALIETLRDRDTSVAQHVALALIVFESKASASIPRLFEMAESAEWELKYGAAFALASIAPKDERTVTCLKKMLQDHDRNCSDAASEALRQLALVPCNF